MALTPDVIKANESLSALTDDQVTAITTLSVNDENNVIGAKVGEIHGMYDTDIKTISGIEKNQGEKSYDYAKRVIGEFKTSAESASTLQTEIDTQKTTIADLNEKIANGNTDEVVKQQLTDANSKLTALQTQYDDDKTKWETERNDFTSKMTGIQVKSEFGKATAPLKFKAGFTEGVQKTLIKSAEDTILGKFKPDWVEADGTKTMVFRDESGEIARNKANGLNPFTASELISEQLKDVLEVSAKKPGTGTEKPGQPGQTKVEIVDIAGAATQVEADDIIVKYLMQTGETRGSASFAEKQKELRDKNNVAKLPLR